MKKFNIIMVRKNKKLNTSAVAFLIITFLAILLFSLDFGGFLHPLRSNADVLTNPIRFWFSRKSRAVSTFFRDLSSISSLREENRSLRFRVLELESELSDQGVDTIAKWDRDRARWNSGA